ncbi:PxKF domain-containing protein [Candidatus Wolfebacteria bacterium]|nr:PxKF domain-containing protein [Candidatus Wolfebacteria bacterium]
MASTTIANLSDGSYHWQARAVDTVTNTASSWQEFGTAGNVDFEVKLVPLYTQIISPYPSETATDEWDDLDYANGNANCGRSIAQCGCALTSGAMVLRYYDDGSITNLRGDITPLTLNDWLNIQPKGYSFGGSVNWLDVARYSNNLVKYDIPKAGDYFNNYAILNEYLDKNQPVIAKEASGRGGINREHFIVIDNKLATTYGVKDPAWYNTKKLNEATDTANKVRGYENGFDGLRLFYLSNGLLVSTLSLNLASPAEFLVTDPLGRKYGKDPSINIEYTEIPDASYFTESIDDPTGELLPSDHENKTLYIENPLDGQYDIKVIGTDSGSYAADSVVYDNQGQAHTQTFTGNTNTNITASYSLNYNSQQPENISIQPTDTEAPIISHIQLNSEYILNSAPIVFNFSANDGDGVGVFKLEAFIDGQSIADGQIINFNQLGTHTIEIVAEDYIGNKRTETIVYKVIYNFGGFLQPIKIDGSGVYKLGRTLPTKFQLKDANGVFVPNATARLFVAKILNSIIGVDEIPLSTSNADTGNIFRYDTENNQYIYNLATNNLSFGPWQLKVILDDGKYYTVVVSIK